MGKMLCLIRAVESISEAVNFYAAFSMKKIIFILGIVVPTFALALEITNTSATLLLRSKGEAMNVIFQTSTSEQPCEGMTRAAGVYDAELLREKLLPFIAKMQQKARALTNILPEAEMSVQADVPLQIQGRSDWSDKVGNIRTSGGCGPFTQQFTPQAGHKYLVLFEFAGNHCGQSVQDITDIAAPIAVEHTPLQCARSFFK